MIRASIVIGVGIFIDLLQACISAALFIIGAFPGTIAGAAAGCAVGDYFFGKIGCWVGGGVLAVIGSHPVINGILATVTVPLGVVIGFAVNICISMTFGVMLVGLLWAFGMFYPQYVFSGGIIELIPGLDNSPGWTTMAILCVIRKKAEDAKFKGNAGGAFAVMALGGVGGAMRGVSNIKQFNQGIARNAGTFTQAQQTAVQEKQRDFKSQELKNIDGINRMPSRQKPPANDNKPKPTYAV